MLSSSLANRADPFFFGFPPAHSILPTHFNAQIRSRLEGPDGTLRAEAARKRIVSSSDTSWVMCRAPAGEGSTVVDVVDSEEAAAHDQEALTMAVDERLAQLQQLCAAS